MYHRLAISRNFSTTLPSKEHKEEEDYESAHYNDSDMESDAETDNEEEVSDSEGLAHENVEGRTIYYDNEGRQRYAIVGFVLTRVMEKICDNRAR